MNIDDKLQRAGARWRAEQSEPPPIDLVRMSRQRRLRWRGALAAAASGVVVLAVIASSLIFRVSETTSSVSGQTRVPTPTSSARSVREGDRVHGMGWVISPGSGPTQLCQTEPEPTVLYPAGKEPPPTCSSITVAIIHFDPMQVPTWTVRQGVGFTTAPVIVRGIWRNGSIDVLSVASTTASTDATAPIPCPPPTGGWLENDFASATARESALASLDALIRDSSDTYVGRWTAHPHGIDNLPAVTVIGTTGDPVDVSPGLREVYPGNLCLWHVAYSTSQLDRIAQRLRSISSVWEVGVRPDLDRVELTVVVLDDTIDSALGQDLPAVDVAPLVVVD